jgi:hypothetical protein
MSSSRSRNCFPSIRFPAGDAPKRKEAKEKASLSQTPSGRDKTKKKQLTTYNPQRCGCTDVPSPRPTHVVRRDCHVTVRVASTPTPATRTLNMPICLCAMATPTMRVALAGYRGNTSPAQPTHTRARASCICNSTCLLHLLAFTGHREPLCRSVRLGLR